LGIHLCYIDIYLNPQIFNGQLFQVTVSCINTLGKYIVKSVFFVHGLVLPAAIENLQNFCGDQMDVAQLWKTLSSLDSSLKEKEFLDAVKLATVDGGYSKC
jgi:hypothetical protein